MIRLFVVIHYLSQSQSSLSAIFKLPQPQSLACCWMHRQPRLYFSRQNRFLTDNGRLPFSGKNRLVESGSKWDASKPRMEISMGCACPISTDIHRDEYKPKGLELVETANGTHAFRSHIPVGNFGLPLKTLRLFRKFSGQTNQNSLSIYIPTEISGFFR